MKCTVLHTTDRKVADSPEFVAPLKDATGVYLEGGRHWRLAEAYLGTLTLKEIFGVLDRGGVVMGGSAGATIQGSYMVRGSSNGTVGSRSWTTERTAGVTWPGSPVVRTTKYMVAIRSALYCVGISSMSQSRSGMGGS